MLRALWLRKLSRVLSNRPFSSRRQRRALHRVRLHLESLEERVTPSTTITVNDPSGGMDNAANVTVATLGSKITLIDAINAANNTGGTGQYVIDLNQLPAGGTITFTKALNNTTITSNNVVQDQNWYGPDALPAISSNIRIEGNGETLAIKSGTAMRFFYVSGGPAYSGGGLTYGTLELDNLTLMGGTAQGGNGSGGGLGAGGAIFNQGTLTLNSDTLTGNKAIGGSGGGDVGGGMGSDGSAVGGGGFGGKFSIPSGSIGGGSGGDSGGGGFQSADDGISGDSRGGEGGGKGGFGGNGGSALSGISGGAGGDGGGGATGNGGVGQPGGGFGDGGVSSSNSGGGGAGVVGGGGGVYNLAYGNNVTTGAAQTATLNLYNSVLGQDSVNGQEGNGTELVSDSEPGKNTNTGQIGGSSNVVQGGAQEVGNGTVASGAIINPTTPIGLSTTLANNGGYTETLAPSSSSSPILGAGSLNIVGVTLPGDDQRGLYRPTTSNPDDDAFQTESTTTTVTNATSSAGQNVTLTAHVYAFGDSSDPVKEGQVQFTIDGSTVTATILSTDPGVATTTFPVPTTISGGANPIDAAYTDPNTPSLYEPSSGTGTLNVTGAATTTSITSTGLSSTYNSTTAQTVTLSANVSSANGGIVNEGTVAFTINGTSLSAPVAVSGGIATTTVSLPTTFAYGSYTIAANYADSKNNYQNSTAAPTGTLTVQTANSFLSVAATNSPVTYNSSSETFDLSANLTSSNGGTVNEGNVVFTINGVSSAPVAVNGGTALTTLTLTGAQLLPAGNYPVGVLVSYTDSATNNYASANAQATVAVNAANTTTTITATPSVTFNSGTTQTVTLSASVASASGGTVSEGTVTFAILGTNRTATANVSGGTATATLTIPAGLAAGAYTINAGYAGTNNYFASASPVTGTLTVYAAATTTITSCVSGIYSSSTTQNVTLTANVSSSNGGAVKEGVVTFSLLNPSGANLTTSAAVNSNGTATATLSVPAGLFGGNYLFTANYADSANANGSLNYASSSSAAAALNIAGAATATSLQQVLILPVGDFALELLTAGVSSPGGVVNGGTLTFDLAGIAINAAVQSGEAMALAIVPLQSAIAPQQLGLNFTPSGLNFVSSSSVQSALTTSLNAFESGFVLKFPDGSEMVSVVINGMLVGLDFNAQGQFIGFNFNAFAFNPQFQFTGIDFDILPDLLELLPLGFGISV